MKRIELKQSDLDVLKKNRPEDSHKGDYGHIAIFGGDAGHEGSIILCGHSALRSGAGKVTLGTRKDHARFIGISHPNLMVRSVEVVRDVESVIAESSVIVVGCGLGQSLWAKKILELCFDSSRPLVVDADGLNLLAKNPIVRGDWILTPHPLEAARLLQTTVDDVQSRREDVARELAIRYGATVVLKGHQTIIADAQKMVVCPFGNPGMAVAGMGDVLSGMIATLWAEFDDAFLASSRGVLWHALSGDFAVTKHGQRSLIASDVIDSLAQVLK